MKKYLLGIKITPPIIFSIFTQKMIFKNEKNNLILRFCLSANLAFSQGKVDKENIVIGKIDSVSSKIWAENRQIWVHIPEKEKSIIWDMNL